MAQTFDTHGDQTFETHGSQEWGAGSVPISPWSNADIAMFGYPFSMGPGPSSWPYYDWTANDSLVILGLYPIFESSVTNMSKQVGGMSQVFIGLKQIGGIGEVYI